MEQSVNKGEAGQEEGESERAWELELRVGPLRSLTKAAPLMPTKPTTFLRTAKNRRGGAAVRQGPERRTRRTHSLVCLTEVLSACRLHHAAHASLGLGACCSAAVSPGLGPA